MHVEQSGPKRNIETRHNGHNTKHKRLGCVLFHTGTIFLGVLNFDGDFFSVPGFSETVLGQDTAYVCKELLKLFFFFTSV